MAKKQPTKEEWLEAISESGGMVSIIAAKLGLCRQTVAKKRDEIAWIKEAFEQATLECTDLAHLCVRNEIKKGNWKVSMWYLERKAKDRGFGKEIRLEGQIEQTRAKIVIVLPDNGRGGNNAKPQ